MSAGEHEAWTLAGIDNLTVVDLLFRALRNLNLNRDPVTRFVIPAQAPPGAGRLEFELRLTVVHDRNVAEDLARAGAGAAPTHHH